MEERARDRTADPPESEEAGLREDARALARAAHLASPDAQQELDLWPDHWAWEEDNFADGEGVGPLPTTRKPPKRATRHPATVTEDPEEDD